MKSGTTAWLLEFFFGLLLCTFGVGHIYAGKSDKGLIIMLGWWFILFLHFLLMATGIPFVSLPILWIIALIVSPINAAQSVDTTPPAPPAV